MGTIADYVDKSVSDARILVEVDLSALNVQWINIGAGIWEVNFDNTYSFVDSSLLDPFSAQVFADVGSVIVDGEFLQKVNTLALVTETQQSFYYDLSSKTLYIRIINYDDPYTHDIRIGNVYGYSINEFTPVLAEKTYEGRLVEGPTITKSRDPLFFGKLSFNETSVSFRNADGSLDLMADSADVYGNEARVKFGYVDVPYTDYITLYTGYVNTIRVGEDNVSISFADKRRQLTKAINFSASAENALDCIKRILVDNYPIDYSETYFDTTAWNSATLIAPDITIAMETDQSMAINEIIEKICGSCFGFFEVLSDGRYSFHFIDTSATAETTIYAIDILNTIEVLYDPTEVLSSIRVNYAYVLDTTAEEDHSILLNTDYETDVYLKYKTYSEQEFDTWLPDATAAETLSDAIMAYISEVHGSVTVEVPMKYYELSIGETVNVELKRGTTIDMLGTKKAEVISISYNLDIPSMSIGLRFV